MFYVPDKQRLLRIIQNGSIWHQIVGMFEDRSWELKLPFGISNARSAVIPWILFLMKWKINFFQSKLWFTFSVVAENNKTCLSLICFLFSFIVLLGSVLFLHHFWCYWLQSVLLLEHQCKQCVQLLILENCTLRFVWTPIIILHVISESKQAA